MTYSSSIDEVVSLLRQRRRCRASGSTFRGTLRESRPVPSPSRTAPPRCSPASHPGCPLVQRGDVIRVAVARSGSVMYVVSFEIVRRENGLGSGWISPSRTPAAAIARTNDRAARTTSCLAERCIIVRPPGNCARRDHRSRLYRSTALPARGPPGRPSLRFPCGRLRPSRRRPCR